MSLVPSTTAITHDEKCNDRPNCRECQLLQGVANLPPVVSSSSGSGLETQSHDTSLNDEPLAPSIAEARDFYAGLPSHPLLIYRSDKEEWSLPTGPEAYTREKQLRPVFNHPIVDLWDEDLCWKVVNILDTHVIRFTTIDVVRFIAVSVDEEDAKEKHPGPVTIWIGAVAESTPHTLAHAAAQEILVLLNEYSLTDVNIHFRHSIYQTQAGPQLLRPAEKLDPCADVVGPLTTALGLHISTEARPNAQGTMALYLKNGDSGVLLGLSCRHVLISSDDSPDLYVYKPHAPSKNVLFLGNRAYADVIASIELKRAEHEDEIECWKLDIQEYMERQQGADIADARETAKYLAETERLVKASEEAMAGLGELLRRAKQDWSELENRVIGNVVYSPPIALGVGPFHFTQDWGLFELDQKKLGNAYQGNRLDLGRKISRQEFKQKCFPSSNANWKFTYPKDHLLSLSGTITDKEMRHPNMWDSNGEPCLFVTKRGNGSGTTIGRANGVFSIVRRYKLNKSVDQTSREWCILPHGSKLEPFSVPGDSGSIIADIHGRIGGMLTGGARSGFTESPDTSYATPWWWLLSQITGTKNYANVYVA